MSMRNILIFSFLAIFMLSACRTVPMTSRRQFLLSSEAQENALGAAVFEEFKAEHPVSRDKNMVQILNRVGLAISDAANKPDYDWEFVLLDSETANAFCLPGGKVAVYSGILPFMSNEAELATVVAHEVAHAVARHSGERMSWAKVQQIGLLGLRGAGASSAWETLYGAGTELGFMLPFSRKHEYEADSIGMILMAKAGYNPNAAIMFWQKFSAGEDASAIQKWVSTHPTGVDRINNMEQLLPQAMQEYQQAAQKRGLGVKW
ncbi:MAG: M48 family metallopeptidase [Oligosphaeraceae bacterium]|nr:M48 family metallopeptidase [Oligosphaeraceae bacterium]